MSIELKNKYRLEIAKMVRETVDRDKLTESLIRNMEDLVAEIQSLQSKTQYIVITSADEQICHRIYNLQKEVDRHLSERTVDEIKYGRIKVFAAKEFTELTPEVKIHLKRN
jgi:hypothetical protein